MIYISKFSVSIIEMTYLLNFITFTRRWQFLNTSHCTKKNEIFKNTQTLEKKNTDNLTVYYIDWLIDWVYEWVSDGVSELVQLRTTTLFNSRNYTNNNNSTSIYSQFTHK